jgi:hypothetical protein
LKTNEACIEATGQKIGWEPRGTLIVDFQQSHTTISWKQRYPMQISNQDNTKYATGEDFCWLFVKEMDSLYLLSFLLTGEHSLAEKCFVHGFEDSRKGNPVFNEWARSWARRTIVQRAIQMIRPQTTHNRRSSPTSHGGASHAMTQPAEIVNIVGLPQFERFVFVMSVLERFSDRECSLLLDCTHGDVAAARTWALHQMAWAAEFQTN